MPVSSCVCVWTAREGNFPHTTNLPSLAELGVTCVDVKKKKKWLKKILLHEFLKPFATRCRPLKKRKNPMKSWQISPFLQKKKNVMLSKMFLIIFFMECIAFTIYLLD